MARALPRAACLTAAVLLLTSPATIAATRRPARSAPTAARSAAVSRAWSTLVSLVGRLGSIMDPDGAKSPSGTAPTAAPPASAPPTGPASDLGSIMDPDG